jgi:metallo-beta-lactamase class B
MTRLNALMAVLACAIAGCAPATPVANPGADQAARLVLRSPESHALAGRAAAEPDFQGLASLCGDPSPVLGLARVTARPYAIPEPIAPARVFDNLYFIGNRFTSAWVVKTSEGLILIDALMHEQEIRRDLEAGFATLGLDPADIRYVVISHGHGDHSGGAAYLGRTYAPQFVMSRIDWEISQDPARGLQLPGWNDVPRPALLVDERMDLVLGDTTLSLILTPGHTPGTLSTIIPLRDGMATHTAVIHGGTGFNFGPLPDQYRQYAESSEAMRQRVLERGIDVFLSNHAARDQSGKRIAALQVRRASDPHPFVMTPDRVSRAYDVLRECALSQLTKIQ